MSCGCNGSGASSAGYRNAKSDCGCRGAGGSIGSRLSMPWGGTLAALPASEPPPRPVPIGARPSVPETQPFEARIFPNDRNVFGDIVYGVFGGELLIMQGDVVRMVNRIPPDRWPAVRDYLFTVPVGFRMPALSQLVMTAGVIDPVGRMYPLPDPVSPVPEPPPLQVTYSITQRPGIIYAPPPPEPQRVCLINGYDPRWGTPPGTYKNIALPFDASSGVYEFDRAYADRNSPTAGAGRPLYSDFDFSQLANFYGSGWQVLQPFKRSMASPWEYRWVFRAANPVVDCQTP